MTIRWVRWALLAAAVALLGCTSSPKGWRHFRGDLTNQGFLDIKSGYAVSPAWKSEPLQITSASPVLGRDAGGAEVLYVGTADAHLVALDAATGSVRWKRTLSPEGASKSIVSTPSIADDGSIVAMSLGELHGGRLRSSLHKVDRAGSRQWSYLFPDGGFSTGSPKTFTFAGQALIVAMVTLGDSNPARSELFVLRDAGGWAELLWRTALSQCPADPRFHSGVSKTWSYLSRATAGPGVLPADASLDPTPAIELGRPKALIAMVDNLCGAGVLEWDGREASVVWRMRHAGEPHSSPAILFNHLMVFGSRTGKLLAYDVETGVKMWEYDAGDPILTTPSGSARGLIYVASTEHLYAIQSGDGRSASPPDTERRLKIPGPTLASPVVTAECVHLPAREMLSVSHDLTVRSYNTAFTGNGLSSPAVGSDGSIYVVAMDGSVWKYRGGY